MIAVNHHKDIKKCNLSDLKWKD